MFPFDLFARFLVDRKFCIASVARIQLNCAPKCNSKLRGNDKNRSRLWSSWCSTVHFDKWQWSFLWWKSSKNGSHPQTECTHFSLVHRARHFENSSTHFSIRYIITVIILPRGHVCSVSRRLVSLQNSYIVIASAKTSGSIYLKVLISVWIVTKTTIGANFLGMKRTQKCEGKLLLCV